jgi:hypothetical protein
LGEPVNQHKQAGWDLQRFPAKDITQPLAYFMQIARQWMWSSILSVALPFGIAPLISWGLI